MDDSDEFNEPYYPARYREHIRKKRQRRLIRKIALSGAAILIIVIIALAAAPLFLQPSQPSQPRPDPRPAAASTTAAATPAPTPAAAPAAAQQTPGTTQVPVTSEPQKTTATPVVTAVTPEPIQTASANTYILRAPDASPEITEQQATIIARTAFPEIPAGEVSVQAGRNPDAGLVWAYTIRAGTVTEAAGLIDATSGRVVSFNRTISPGGRPQNPVLTLDAARVIADKTISDKNNVPLSLNMTSAGYMPLASEGGSVAGTYRFFYTRMVDDYPCDADGFVVSVDAISGAVTEYAEHWQTPDNAFGLAGDILVPRYDATFAVQTRAKSLYPSSVTSIRILSSDLRWMDHHDPATTPRPGTVPLAWKVVFDDDVIRSNSKLAPGVAWVDPQSGEVISIEYQH